MRSIQPANQRRRAPQTEWPSALQTFARTSRHGRKMARFGISQEHFAQPLGINAQTLRKHFRVASGHLLRQPKIAFRLGRFLSSRFAYANSPQKLLPNRRPEMPE
jgi:hypothetical protein